MLWIAEYEVRAIRRYYKEVLGCLGLRSTKYEQSVGIIKRYRDALDCGSTKYGQSAGIIKRFRDALDCGSTKYGQSVGIIVRTF